jgi:protein OPY2
VLTSQSCAACPSTSCMKGGLPASSSSTPSPSSGGSKPNTGAIAGGVIGGVVVIGIITFLVWIFCIKGRRREQLAEEDWSTQDAEKREQFTMRRDARASTHTVGSIASTVFTRASNIIQIAYIPGVTNRSPPSSPGLLVPPVPPLPISSNASSSSSPSYQHDQHFFMPGDLRDSTYSGISDGRSIRTSVTPSLARSSVATTIYRSNAIVEPVPAQTVVRGRAAMVSVKPSSSPMLSPVPVPPVPAIDYVKHGQKPKNDKEPGDVPPPSPAFSVGSTFLSSTAGTAKAVTARPIQVKSSKTDKQQSENEAELAPFVLDDLGIRPERPRVSVATAASSHSRARRGDVHSMDLEDTDDETHSRSRRSLLDNEDKHNSHITVIEDTPNIAQSPFSDTEIGSSPDTPSQANPIRSSRSLSGTSPTKRVSQAPPQLASSNLGSLGVVIEEPTKPANKDPAHSGSDSTERGTSPFGDENEIESLK